VLDDALAQKTKMSVIVSSFDQQQEVLRFKVEDLDGQKLQILKEVGDFQDLLLDICQSKTKENMFQEHEEFRRVLTLSYGEDQKENDVGKLVCKDVQWLIKLMLADADIALSQVFTAFFEKPQKNSQQSNKSLRRISNSFLRQAQDHAI